MTIILSSLINLGSWELFSRLLKKKKNLINGSARNCLAAAAGNDLCDWSTRLIIFSWDVVIAIISFTIMIDLKCNILVSTSFRWVRQQLGSTRTRAECVLDLLIYRYHANPVKVINWCYNLLYVIMYVCLYILEPILLWFNFS